MLLQFSDYATRVALFLLLIISTALLFGNEFYYSTKRRSSCLGLGAIYRTRKSAK